MSYPHFLGDERQQVIIQPGQMVSAWCLVSPTMSLFPSDDDEYQILPVEAMVVEKNLSGKKLLNPQSVSITYRNPLTGMERYEIIPLSSPRFNVQSIPSTKVVYQEMGGKLAKLSPPMPVISTNLILLLLSISAIFSIGENRNN